MAWKKLTTTAYTKSWILEEMGDLEGEYLESHESRSKKGKPLMFHTFKRKNGEVVSVLGGAVLDKTFPAKIAIGKTALIHALGMVDGENGPYKGYEVSEWVD